jgi:hypothetical protein
LKKFSVTTLVATGKSQYLLQLKHLNYSIACNWKISVTTPLATGKILVTTPLATRKILVTTPLATGKKI